MTAHVRVNLLLLGLTLLICAVLYPLAVLGVSLGLFHEQAEGSIVRHDGQAVGSSLVAQEFKVDNKKWFQPRPSAASWKGDASSGSNLGGNNPLLRDRVAHHGSKTGILAATLLAIVSLPSWTLAEPNRALGLAG